MPFRLFMICLVLLLTSDRLQAQNRQAFQQDRDRMVDEEIVAAGVTNERVINAMRRTPRHEFVSLTQRKLAYYDMALPIGSSQTISPPFVVAYMTEQLDPQPGDRVLEIGTGSGYQAAVLSGLVRKVYSIEIVESLARKAKHTLKKLRYENVHTKSGDGYQGWAEHAPFDKIIVTCSPERIPSRLVAQLREGGRMIVPVGKRYQQNLYLLKKVDGRMEVDALRPTLFVPMTGEAERRRQVKPNPANPSVSNGSFEEALGDPPIAIGWHYQRQAKRIAAEDSPNGAYYMKFDNSDRGRGCRALQGMPVDGRKVKHLEVSLFVRGKDIRPGLSNSELPVLAIAFYDKNRAEVGRGLVGPWRGTFKWRKQVSRIHVPIRAREAIVRIGLLGAVGELDVDNILIDRVEGNW